MAASISGSLKALIEAAGLGLAVFRDDAGSAATGTAWVTVAEALSVTRDRLGDEGAADALTELVQVDLWQPWRQDPVTGGPAEDYDLADQLFSVLHGAQLSDAPVLVRSCTVDSVVRLVERESNLVHHAFTVRLRREPA